MSFAKLGFLSLFMLVLMGAGCAGSTTEGDSMMEDDTSAPAAELGSDMVTEDGVICCEWGGASGSSTQELCDSYGGTAVPLSKCGL